MEIVKKTDAFSIYKKRSGRHGVKNAEGKWINGEEKEKILLGEKLIKVDTPKKKEEAPAEEGAAES